MTSFAMIAGMIPMALALGEGGEQTAPLGRAVIGGLVGATFTTLTILPAIFALVQSRASTASVSLYLLDPQSPYYLPGAGQFRRGICHADESESRRSIDNPGSSHSRRNTNVREIRCSRLRRSALLVLVAAMASLRLRQALRGGRAGAAPTQAETPLVHPQWKTFENSIEQPGWIKAFEQAALYAKINGYVEKVNVEIGSRVHKGDVLAVLRFPNMTKD